MEVQDKLDMLVGAARFDVCGYNPVRNISPSPWHFIHRAALPGASFDCVEEGCRLATRVSVNMEAPTVQHLAKLSSRKDLYQGIPAYR